MTCDVLWSFVVKAESAESDRTRLTFRIVIGTLITLTRFNEPWLRFLTGEKSSMY